jgi:phosphohistidine phosphatase
LSYRASIFDMKYLTVFRHAKSDWGDPSLPDHDRTLNERGLRAAPVVARFLRNTYFGGNGTPAIMPAPDCIISSTAERAWTTAKLAGEQLGVPTTAVALDSRLYLASHDTILEVVRGIDEASLHCVLFGHNPGMHDFVNQVLSRASVPRMPTCTAVIIGLPHEFWGLADWSEGQLIGYITPKALERRFPQECAGISKQFGDD